MSTAFQSAGKDIKSIFTRFSILHNKELARETYKDALSIAAKNKKITLISEYVKKDCLSDWMFGNVACWDLFCFLMDQSDDVDGCIGAWATCCAVVDMRLESNCY